MPTNSQNASIARRTAPIAPGPCGARGRATRRAAELVGAERAPLDGERLRASLHEGQVVPGHLPGRESAGLGHQDDLGAQGPHHARSLAAVALRHHGHERMPAHGAHDRQARPRVAARELNDRLTRSELAGRRCFVDDLPRDAILLREAGVEVLELRDDPTRQAPRHPGEIDDGRVSDRLDDRGRHLAQEAGVDVIVSRAAARAGPRGSPSAATPPRSMPALEIPSGQARNARPPAVTFGGGKGSAGRRRSGSALTAGARAAADPARPGRDAGIGSGPASGAPAGTTRPPRPVDRLACAPAIGARGGRSRRGRAASAHPPRWAGPRRTRSTPPGSAPPPGSPRADSRASMT